MAGNTTDIQVLNDLKVGAANVLNEIIRALGVRSMRAISPSHFKALRKDKASELLHQALSVLDDVSIVFTTDFKMAPNCVKNQMFESEQKIVKLQSELIESRNEQLESFKAAVISSIGETVKAEFKTYSAALQKDLIQNHQ